MLWKDLVSVAGLGKAVLIRYPDLKWNNPRLAKLNFKELQQVFTAFNPEDEQRLKILKRMTKLAQTFEE